MKLTKEDLDKVRNIEGFPIGKDEDIIALSRPPYYTACPNPFIKEFIEENGTPYDEKTDDYRCEPFAADVSEGKHDPIYMAHSYHTKVPYKAIMRYILHYTKPGDIVLDGFCGTGMTGVAAQRCAAPDYEFKAKVENEMCDEKIKWGGRYAILNDLSSAATFISFNYNSPIDLAKFADIANKIINKCENEIGWMYRTKHVDDKGHTIKDICGNDIYGTINYVVWSDVLVCPTCSNEFAFWDVAVDAEIGNVKTKFECPYCHSKLTKADCSRSIESYYDKICNKRISKIKQNPIFINYCVGKKHFKKMVDEEDKKIIRNIENEEIPYWFPSKLMMNKGNHWGDTWRAGYHQGITHVHQFYTKRNLTALSYYWHFTGIVDDKRVISYLRYLFTSVFSRSHKLNRYMPNHFRHVGPLSGTLYIPTLQAEINIFDLLKNKLSSILKAQSPLKDEVVTMQSASNLPQISNNSIDYIFTDPPFGDNLMYSELNFLIESWLNVETNSRDEAIINQTQDKHLDFYHNEMQKCFNEYYRVLKPNRWMTVEFHNSKNIVWNIIQEAINAAGFIIANVDTIDKKKGTTKQLTYASTVKQDLVISAYKPKESFVRNFREQAGSSEMVWEFIQQHLSNVPIAPDANNNGKIDIVAERCDYLLFDRMVAYHIMNGIPVPMDAHTFYDGLRQRFIERDGMFFNADQVNKYDEKRLTMEVEDQQMALFVTDEKNAIAWLHQLLDKTHLSYQEIQPKYLQELHQDKREEIPELLDMLKENFVQDVAGKWYIPDLTDAADLAKLRRKKLLKEFYDSYAAGKQKIKVARQEAIRVGFDDCWAKKDYATIVHVGDRLPEAVLQEDQALLMYYDNASSRV